MDNVLSLLEFAEEQGIDVDWFPMIHAESLSAPLGDEYCGIAIDPSKIKSLSDLLYKLSHELGHCMTGSFYNRYSSFDCRQRHENRADKWAIRRLISEKDLGEAVAEGCTELWALADRFGLPEDFIKKTVCYYIHGNVATELYF